MPLSCLPPTFQEPNIHIDSLPLDLWKHDQLENADMLLTATITASSHPSPHVLASRGLIRARLQDWDAALVDARKVLGVLIPRSLTLTLI